MATAPPGARAGTTRNGSTPPPRLINYRGWPVHHAIECFGQVGGCVNMMFNRDDMIHSAVELPGLRPSVGDEAANRARRSGAARTAIDEAKGTTRR